MQSIRALLVLCSLVMLTRASFAADEPSLEKRIMLPDYSFVAYNWSSSFTGEGTWVGDAKHEQMHLEASHIFCDHAQMICYESVATIMSEPVGVLRADLVIWELASWTESRIVSKPDVYPCLFNVLHINRKTQTVTQVETVTRTDGPCEMLQLTPRDTWTLKLTSGMQLYLRRTTGK